MTRLERWIITGRGYLGVSGIVGIVLLITATLAWLSTIIPLQHKISAAPEFAVPPVAIPTDPALITETDPLADFYHQLPKEHGFSPQMNSLYNIAKTEGLVLAEGTYQVVSDPDRPVARREITLPMKGTYVQIRRFLRRVLSDFPNVALDHLILERPAANVGIVDAHVQLVWYMVESP